MKNRSLLFLMWVGLTAFLVTGCETAVLVADLSPTTEIILPTVAATVATLTPLPTHTPVATLPPTWTPPAQIVETATPLGEFQFTRQATNTPWPTFTATSTETATPANTVPPTETPTPTATETTVAQATDTAVAQNTPSGDNWLPNGSFEEGWYHPNGDPELQIPDQWRFEFDEGNNPLDPDPWNKWVRPEVRVLSPDFLPPAEHDLFIWDGQQTVKIFKGSGSISVRLFNSMTLSPGTYKFNIQIYPDLVSGYDDYGGKIWADDELSGEVRLMVDGYRSDWQLPSFGRKNNFSHTFTIPETQNVTVGVAIRGRWALANNGWFMDDWSVTKID